MKQIKIFEANTVNALEKKINKYLVEELDQELVIDIKMSTNSYLENCYYQAMVIYEKEMH